jgi:phytoene dehydrogenase-like protein
MLKAFSKKFCSNASLGKEGGIQFKRNIQHKLVQNPTDNRKFTLEKNKEIDMSPYIYNKPKGLQNYQEIFKTKYDAVIIGAGHNGLVCANYLAQSGQKVLVLEKRHVVGGCAVTEELVEGYKLSRCSYVLSLFRKKIIEELFPEEFYKKIKLYIRNPKGLTPTKEDGKYLVRRSDREDLKKEIRKFSIKDAEAIDEFDNFLNRMVSIVDPLIDIPPPEKFNLLDKNFRKFLLHILRNSKNLYEFYHFLTASAEYYLDKYLESDILKGTFATDAVIGAMKSPRCTGSAYVLLHHVMGTLDKEGSWFYVEGGNGAISKFLADQAVQRGVTIALNCPVERFLTDENNKKISGVKILNINEANQSQSEKQNIIYSDKFIVNCDLYTTYFKLMSKDQRQNLLSKDFISSLEKIEYTSPVMKINLVVEKLPRFKCFNKDTENISSESDYEKFALDYLTGTIHMNSDSIDAIDSAYIEALSGKPSSKPIIEMTIPSLLDKTLTPKNSGHHVIGLFCQYAPNKLNDNTWTNQMKRDYANKIYEQIDKYAPGFSQSILFDDILSPTDLENEFGVRGGNIFHGSMDLSSVFFCRPFLNGANYKQPIENLYSCSAAMHPGGGVMGAPGRNCALRILNKH